MVPWIQVYSNILTHDKTYSLSERLKIQNYSAVGLMVSLWSWVAINAPDGDISRYPKKAIAEAAGWNKKAEPFWQILLDVKLIEILNDNRVVIRNWERYATLLMDMQDNQKKKTNERVKRYREKKKRDDIADCNVTCNPDCNVTDTLCNAPTEHNTTIHNTTIHNNNSGVDDDINLYNMHARDLMAVVDNVDNCVEMTPELKAEVKALSEGYFMHFFNRKPTQEDTVWVWWKVQIRADNGEWQVSKDRVEMLEYAFQEALKSNALNVKYIDGIYSNFYRRGIKTMEDIARFDFERDKDNGKI